jgi:hypothetical protein
MSLAGNLSDLSLPELLQVASLSRKTGTLEIRRRQTRLWIGLREGGIVRVAVEGGRFDAARVLARTGISLDAPPEQAERALRDAAVRVLLATLNWDEGEFVLHAGGDPGAHWQAPEGISLASALSPEFLALEGARLADEAEETEHAEQATDRPADPSTEIGPSSPAPEPVRCPPVICVDADLALLEQIKGQLSARGARVHIFQDTQSALARLKQYLLCGERPALALGAEVLDPLEGHRGMGWQRLAQRVRGLAPGTPIAVLGRGAARAAEGVRWIERPDARAASDVEVGAFVATLANAHRVGA